jgi:hypothetical protein
MSDSISTSVSAAMIFSALDGRFWPAPPKRNDIVRSFVRNLFWTVFFFFFFFFSKGKGCSLDVL